MIFNTYQRTEADNVFSVVLNVTGGALVAGDTVVWDKATPDGVRVTVPATLTLSLFKGVVVEPIAASGYGKVQVYGYYASARVTNTTNQAIAAGDILIPADAVDHLKRSGASDGKSGFVYAAEGVATAATPSVQTKGVFIRAL